MRRSVVPNRLAALSIAILLALVALTISGVIATMASGTETRSLTSAADTQIVENAPTKNYGAATSLGVNENDQSNIGKDKFALVRWDLSGIAPRTQISSASVTLNVTNVSPQTYQAYVLKEPWVESAATWNVYSGGMPWEVAGAKGPLDKEATVAGSITPSVKGKNTLTLPLAVVQGWVDNPTTNQGIIIANPSSTRGFNFDSREDPDPTRRPQLTLDLSPDTTPPETTIDSGLSGTISVADATFAFSSDETNSTFECRLDGTAYSACTSPKSYTDLSNGSHTFDVRATDGAGNVDASPASRTFSVEVPPPPQDTTPPETTIDSGPSGTIDSTSASFEFSSTESGSTFECSLDGGAFASCSSPHRVDNLSEGSHTLQVRTTDAAGNTDASPASTTWTVDTTPPDTKIVSNPSALTNSASASFEFSSTEPGSSFQCKLDSGTYESCTSPDSLTGLSDGPHTFSVKATDAAGNTDASPASTTWTVDTTAPETTIDTGPSGTISVADATFAFSSDETNSTFECSLDGAAYSTCSSPTSYAKLSNGSHTFDVRATDGAGNTDATPDKRNLSIDLSPIGPTNPYPGIRFFPVMGVYQGANGFLSESNLIENQYSTYVGTNENSYLDLNDGDGTRYWFCGGRKYRMRDFYVNESLAPSSRAQAQDPNWSNYKWNQNDVVDAMLDNSSAVRAEKAKACLFVAYSASSESDAVPQWMINDPDGLTWNGQGGVHVRMDKTEVLQGVTDFYIALIKHYGGDERIAQLSIGEYYPNADNPLTSTQTATFRSNMKTFWTDIIAAAPVDANGERLNILQSNPITTGGQVTLADIRSIDIGVTGSDPDMFAGGMTDANQSQLYGDVPLEHQTNAHRLIDGYPITWDGTSNPWGFRAGTMNAIRYEYLVWYHSSQGPVPFDSMLMRDNANLVSQWHEAWSQNGLNGSFAAQWGYLPNYPVVP